MEILKSKKFKIPTLYFISDRNEIKDIPVGVPFIYGEKKVKPDIIRILEYEVLYQEAVKTGYPFNFKQILKDNGYKGLKDFWFSHPVYMDIKTDESDALDYFDEKEIESIEKDSTLFKEFVKDSAAYVDIQKLKDLNVFPIWLDKIEDAVHTNIHNFALYNPNMYNKKLEGMYGSIDLVSPNRNLIIGDLSGSIPKAISATFLILSKNLAENFYADLLITGSKSTLYEYENLYTLDINTIYEENGMDNDQVYFKKLVTEDKRHYKTAIVFGDNHSPSYAWNNEYNKGTKAISREDGKKLCQWEVDKVISFHTGGTHNIAGYADWFSPKEVEKIEDWVKYLN